MRRFAQQHGIKHFYDIGRHGIVHQALAERGHALPGTRLAAGEAALGLAGRQRRGDLLLVLLSGGGSSLLAAPAEGLTLDDKAQAIALLMAAGAPIAPASPQPLTPSGLCEQGVSRVSTSKFGRSLARGMQ